MGEKKGKEIGLFNRSPLAGKPHISMLKTWFNPCHLLLEIPLPSPDNRYTTGQTSGTPVLHCWSAPAFGILAPNPPRRRRSHLLPAPTSASLVPQRPLTGAASPRISRFSPRPPRHPALSPPWYWSWSCRSTGPGDRFLLPPLVSTRPRLLRRNPPYSYQS